MLVSENYFDETFDEAFVQKQPEVKILTGMLNLLSHENPFISEQISILLANVSNSPYFKYYFVTDRCIKSLISILRFHSKHLHTEVSLLAILIAVLNLSAMGDIVSGIENMQFLNSLQEIIKNQALPYVNKSIGLLAISNIYTLSKKVDISMETQEFAFRILRSWKTIQEEDKENAEVIMNLVYASLILFYNILLRKPQRDIVTKLITYLTENIMDFFTDSQIVNVILELITLFTKDKETSAMLFKEKKILSYVFSRLTKQKKSAEAGNSNMETVKLAALALSRLASRFDEKVLNCEFFIEQLKNFDNFDWVIENISAL